jgi:cytochrome c-type biogenesis protein CcmF
MTIHPPVLFLGFASVLIPFAFVMASLWRGDYKGWVKPALPWSLFSIAIFGTGILMGGAWAYESLSFGGFWAWDPVENMSFVPWLLVLAGLHLHVVYKHTGHSLLATYIFYALGWLMVLYSTFLTRSGILGDTSVHAFTDLGMSGQLLVYAGAYLFPAIILIAIRYSSMPKQEKEEPLLSREFWMFIGALIMLLSAVQMTFTTSIPVWNKLFGLELAPPADVIAHYNNVQIWIALLAAMGSGFVLFLSYKTNRFSSFIKFVLISLVLSLIFGFLIAYGTEIEYIAYFGEHKIPFVSPYFLLLITSLFAAFAALFYMIFVIKGRVNNIGGSVSHFGFGIFLVGVLISQYKMHVVSLNNEGVNFGEGFEGKEMYENILLVRDSVYEMGGYQVVYSKRESSKISNVYQVDYKKTIGTKVVEQFSLSPYVILNERMGNSSNPSTKHYWDKDVFTHVVAASDLSTEKDSASIVSLALGDTTYLNRSMIVFESIDPKPKLDNQHEGMLAVKANLKIKDLKGLNESASPVFLINQKSSNEVSTIPYENKTLGIYVDIKKIDPDTKKFTFSVKEKNLQNDFIIMKAIVFPYINLVWLGGILTFLGALMSMWYRRKN